MWRKEAEEEGGGQRSAPTTMATYNEAVDKFTKSATSFMEQLNHLNQAREAYQQAMVASAELRTVLDVGDQALRTLMAELEQAISVQLPAAEKRKLDLQNIEAIRGNGERTAVKAFP